MKVTIVTPQKKLFEEEAVQIILPGEDGEFSVMDFHQPCLSSLRAGQVTVETRDPAPLGPSGLGYGAGEGPASPKLQRGERGTRDERRKFPIKRGVARVEGGALTVMAEVY